MAPSDNYEGPKDGIRETRKEDWLQYHIYYSFSPERFKEIEPTKEGLFDNFLGEVSGDPSRVLGRYQCVKELLMLLILLMNIHE